MASLHLIDPPRTVLYLALLAGACAPSAPGSVVPAGARPAGRQEAEAWFAALRSGQQAPVLHRFRWQYRDLAEAAGGQGSARITAGDSLRFDVVGVLGSGRGAAFVVGDTARWTEPEEDVARFVPNYPLLWAMLGVPRMPVDPDEIRRGDDVRLVAWRFVTGTDTVEVARIAGPPVRLITDVRRADGRLGRVETVFRPDGTPERSRLVVPATPARLDITYVSSEKGAAFPPDTWARPGRR